MTRSTVLKPLGLIREPNEHGQYPDGALDEARNCVLRRLGILEPVPAFAYYRSNALDAGYVFRRMWPSATGLFGLGSNGLDFDLRFITTLADTSPTFPELTELTVEPGRAHMAVHRGRHYFTSDQGVLSLESESASQGYLAGFMPPSDLSVQAVDPSTEGQALEPETNANWRALFARKAADGSFIKIGPPSFAVGDSNAHATLSANVTLRVGWNDEQSLGLRAGDLIELYRTSTQPLNTDPGDTYLLAGTHELTSSDLVAGFVDIVDTTPDGALGAALYTNAGEEGSGAAKFPPPYATDLHVHKGHMFYIAPLLTGYVQLRIPGKWGALSTDSERLYGIGSRSITCTFTVGSAVLTGVSNFRGLAVGQGIVSPFRLPAGTLITAINEGAGEITVSNLVLSLPGSATAIAHDILEINGDLIDASNPQALASEMDPSNQALLTFDQAVGLSAEGMGFRITQTRVAGGVPTVRGTNGQNYQPPLPDLDEAPLEGSQDQRFNRLLWSELDQPEAVPAGNEIIVGSGELYRIIATIDALYVFASDGLHRVSGFAPDWRVDPIDPTLILAARNALDLARQVIWAGTNRGLVAVTDGSGVAETSTGLIPIGLTYLPGSEVESSDTWERYLACDESQNEVWYVRTAGFATVYNTLTHAFTEVSFEDMGPSGESVTAATYLPHLPGIVFGSDLDPAAVRKFDATLRAEGARIRHQPFSGDGDPFTSKNWIDCAWLMRIPTDDLTLRPTMNGSSFPIDALVTVPFSGSSETSRGVSGITLSAAFSAAIRVSWEMIDNPTQAWEHRGLSLRYRLVTEQGPVR